MRRLQPRVLFAFLVVVLLAWVAREAWSRLTPEPAPPGDFEARVPMRESLDVEGPIQLEFDSLDGSLSVKAGAPGKLEIIAFKTADGATPEEATARATEMPLVIRREADRLIFSARANGTFPWSARPPLRVDYQIVAPEQSGISVVDGKGRVDATGLHRDVKLAGEDLTVRLTNVGGVSVATKHGGILVDGADGPVSLRTEGGGIQARHVSGPGAELSAEGEVVVAESEVAERLSVQSTGKLVSLQRVRGRQIEVMAQQGSIELADTTVAEALRLEGGRRAVTVDRAQAHPLAVTTTGGGVELTGVQGEIEVTTAGGPASLFSANAASLSVSSGGGDVFFSGSLPVRGATSVDTGGGKLQLTVARESTFTLDADSGPGRLTVSQSLLSGVDLAGGRARAPINGGGPEVVLRTRGGPLSVTTR